jgi:hypothetical protein
MPMYTYQCQRCGSILESFFPVQERDDPWYCLGDSGYDDGLCGGLLKRVGLDLPNVGSPAYQMKAILSNGAKVAGHFGKDAKRKRN